ncbi:tetratricopeptide repeat protein [Ruegeria arenilitoris]|uniref:tetratricopeptide repeat protein n=1 Tax=Ruegeria arenilitoris TaxID=1173585 RepID=UPI001479CE98|nr:tetratricopeptide repeat protein [Ruegeria arenilitoris]
MKKVIKSTAALLFLFLWEPVTAGTYEDGLAAAKRGDMATAVKLWTPLAERGDPQAQYDLGWLYFMRQPKDCASAIKWWNKAGNNGHSVAQYNIALAYDTGLCLPKNRSKAAVWYQLAAKRGYAPAQNNLAVLYDNGNGVERNKVKAYMWWTMAIENGHKRAPQFRKELSSRMTPSEISEATKRAKACRSSKYKRCD